MNILVLTALEKVHSGVLPGQLVGPLKNVKRLAPENRITLVSLTPLHHHLRYRARSMRLKKELRESGIRWLAWPLLFYSRDIYLRIGLLPFLLVQAVPALAAASLFSRAQVIHARSYPAALIACLAGALMRLRIVFDMRGLYIDEAVLTGRFSPGSCDVRIWRRIERALFRHSRAVVGVSSGFRSEWPENLGPDRGFVIPCSAEARPGAVDDGERKRMRGELGAGDRPLFVYSGSVGLWTSMELLFSVFGRIRSRIREAFLLILTQSSDALRYSPGAACSDSVRIRRLFPEQTKEWLSIGDAALLVREPHRVHEAAFPVKFGEYLAAGLPVLVTRSVSAVAALVEEHRCGRVIEGTDDPALADKARDILRNRERYRRNGRNLLEKELAVSVAARRWLDVYRRCMRA